MVPSGNGRLRKVMSESVAADLCASAISTRRAAATLHYSLCRTIHCPTNARKNSLSHLSRNLTTLAPEIQAAILDETLPDTVSLFDLASDTPLSWEEQRGLVAGSD